jgi:hypothetical protein
MVEIAAQSTHHKCLTGFVVGRQRVRPGAFAGADESARRYAIGVGLESGEVIAALDAAEEALV